MKKIIILLTLVLFVFACKEATSKSAIKDLSSNEQEHPGKKIMETQCYVCHNPDTEHDSRIAPPMIAIKRHYISDNTTKEEFLSDMQLWIKEPSEDIAKMPGAIKNFGIMPYAAYSEDDIAQIADYMFDYELEAPEWFEDHFNKEHPNKKGKGKRRGLGKGKKAKSTIFNKAGKSYEDIGLHYALSTKKELGKNLMGTIQKKGTVEALKFCNEQAYPITDSMSTIFDANIKRVSDKPRNMNNRANKIELKHISTFKAQVANKQTPKAIIEEEKDVVKFYYPITTNSMCLQCHGKKDDQIQPDAYKTLKLLYPEDKATGYDVNQVRGIWSITFNKTL